MGDQVHFQGARQRVAPVREGPHGDLLLRPRGGPPLFAAGRVATRRPEQAVDRRSANGEELLADGGIEGQMAVPFQGLDEAGQDGLEPLAADAVGGLPQDDKGLSDGLTVCAAVDRRGLRRVADGGAEESNGVLAMVASDGHELVEGFGLLGLGGAQVALAQRIEEFGPRLPAHGGWHRRPPRVGNILLRQ